MRTPRDDLPAEYVRSRLEYDPLTGEFRWRWSESLRHKSWNTKYAGKKAGFVCQQGYLIINLLDKPYKAHRLAWLIVYGVWPDVEIDHRDLDKSNNRIENLRLSCPVTNHGNLGLFKNNTSGFKGVSWDKRVKKWSATIKVNKISTRLGFFDDKVEAARAYNAAAIKGFGQFARINNIN